LSGPPSGGGVSRPGSAAPTSWQAGYSGSEFLFENNFDTLGAWLVKHGSDDFEGTEPLEGLEADEYLAGFLEAAQVVWHELQPLIDEDETVLQRRIDLLQDIERNMLAHGPTTTSSSTKTVVPKAQKAPATAKPSEATKGPQ